ncbi:MAG: hypothetical protein ABII82_00075 [Verrucomicrobiota bacterium]
MKPTLRRFLRWFLGLTVLALVSAYVALSGDDKITDLSDLVPTRSDCAANQNGYPVIASDLTKLPAFSHMERTELEELLKTGDWQADEIADLLEASTSVPSLIDAALKAPCFQAAPLLSYEQSAKAYLDVRSLKILTHLRAMNLVRAGKADEAALLLDSLGRLGHRIEYAEAGIMDYVFAQSVRYAAISEIGRLAAKESLSPETLAMLRRSPTLAHYDESPLKHSIKIEFSLFSRQIDQAASSYLPRSNPVRDDLAFEIVRWLPLSLKPKRTKTIQAEFVRECLMLAGTDQRTVAASDLNDQFFPRFKGSISPDNIIGRAYLSMLTPTWLPLINQRFRIQSQISATQALLAVRAYQHDHDGELPPTLDALVPDYLPTVPLDYYDREPIRYSREFRAIWSLGRNGEYTVTSADQPIDDREVDLRLP